jgi:hypothetical protein
MVKLEVISPPLKRLRQQELLMAKLEVISTPKKTETTGTTDGKAGGDKPSNKKTETIGTTDGKTGVD